MTVACLSVISSIISISGDSSSEELLLESELDAEPGSEDGDEARTVEDAEEAEEADDFDDPEESEESEDEEDEQEDVSESSSLSLLAALKKSN
mmetsp:Transcript_64665/g.123423  ORF Transcript_64665/g.123423 Transcript_64665/m.123423 type:complete len:93 (+) Transcript_64665:510-788(+)